jgi:hypothetical protein
LIHSGYVALLLFAVLFKLGLKMLAQLSALTNRQLGFIRMS